MIQSEISYSCDGLVFFFLMFNEKLYNFILFIYNDSKEKFWIIVIKGFLILDLSKPKQNSSQELSGYINFLAI